MSFFGPPRWKVEPALEARLGTFALRGHWPVVRWFPWGTEVTGGVIAASDGLTLVTWEHTDDFLPWASLRGIRVGRRFIILDLGAPRTGTLIFDPKRGQNVLGYLRQFTPPSVQVSG